MIVYWVITECNGKAISLKAWNRPWGFQEVGAPRFLLQSVEPYIFYGVSAEYTSGWSVHLTVIQTGFSPKGPSKCMFLYGAITQNTIIWVTLLWKPIHFNSIYVNPLNPELNPICYLLALLRAHHFLHISRIRIKSLTLRQLMSYIYIWSTHSWCF